MGKFRSLCWSLVVVMALGLAGCGGDAPEQKSPSGSTEVRLGVLKVGATSPVQLGIDEDFFADAGIDLNIKTFAGGAEIVPLLVSGDIDVAFTNHVATINAIQAGIDMHCITSSDSAPVEGKDTGRILVKASGGIKRLADLEGKKLAINSVGSLADVLIQALFEKNGLDYSKVRKVEVPFPNMGDVIKNNQADAAAIVEPFASIIEGSGDGRSISGYVGDVQPGLELGCFAVTGEFARKNPDLVLGFADAYDRAKELAQQDGSKAQEAIASWTGMEPKLVAQTAMSAWDAGFDPADLQVFADLMYRSGLIKQKFDADAATLGK